MASSKTPDLPVESTRQPTPVLSLRDVVVYPHMVIPLFVGRERSVSALDEAMNVDKRILLITQKSPETEEPSPEDLFEYGTLATILQMLRLPDGTTKVLVEGVERVRVTGLNEDEGYLAGSWKAVPAADDDTEALDVTARSLLSLFEQYVKLSRKIPVELLTTLSGIHDPAARPIPSPPTW